MTKHDLVVKTAEKGNIMKKDATLAIEAFVEVVSEQLSKGEKVLISGFGTFEVVEKAARKGINPNTKQEIQIPAKKAPKFKFSKNVKELVR
jgi:DNA-binding protein HU-beta